MGKEGEHLKLFLESGDHQLEAVAFRKGSALEELNNMKIIDMIYNLEVNDYFGQERIQAVLKDYRQACGDSYPETASASEEPQIVKRCNSDNQRMILTRQILVDFYKELRKIAKTPFFFYN